MPMKKRELFPCEVWCVVAVVDNAHSTGQKGSKLYRNRHYYNISLAVGESPGGISIKR